MNRFNLSWLPDLSNFKQYIKKRGGKRSLVKPTQHKHNDVAGNLTQAQHKKENNEDRPGWSESHSTAEDAEDGDGPKQDRLPAKTAATAQ